MGQRAIHFGTGALGLGLICWAFRSLGLKVVAVNRSAANNDRNDKLKKDRGFMVRYPSDPEETERVELEDFYYVPEASREVDTLVRDPKTVILTTALKYTGIESMRDVLKELFIARSETRSPLLFIACENAISSQDAFDSILKGLTDAEKSAIQAFVIPVNCVVDRICNKPVMEDQSVVVTSEKFAHQPIEDIEKSREILSPLLANKQTPSVELVASIKPYVLRKKWVVNALHLSMAILAHSQGRALINEFLKENYGNLFLRGFAAELRTVFEVCLRESKEEFFFEKKQLDTYFYNTCTRISGHPQKVTDATTRLNKAMVFDFIKDFNRKVVEPFLIYTETTSESLRFIPAVIGLVDTIIAEERFV